MRRKLFPARKPRKPTQPKMLELFAEQYDWADSRTTTVKLHVPVKLVSEANQREHWATKHRRKKEQQQMMCHALPLAARLLRAVGAPIKDIVLTRFGRRMDADNAVGAFKHVQDEIATFLGADDGDLDFDYEQLPPLEGRIGLSVKFNCERQT